MNYLSMRPDLAIKDRLDASDVAAILGCKPQTVQRLTRRHKLPEPAQTQPFLAWDAATFWPVINSYLGPGEHVHVPVQHWQPSPSTYSRIEMRDGYIRVEYQRPHGGIALVYPRERQAFGAGEDIIRDSAQLDPAMLTAVVLADTADENGRFNGEPTGFKVACCPPGFGRGQYDTNTAVIARVLGQKLPYWAPGYGDNATAGYGSEELILSPRSREEYAALRAAAQQVDQPLIASAFGWVANKIAHDDYQMAAELLDEARAFDHLHIEQHPRRVRPAPDDEVHDWAELARTVVGTDGDLPGAANALRYWNCIPSGYVMRDLTPFTETVEKFISRLDVVDPDEATLGHVALANVTPIMGRQEYRKVTYYRDPCSPDTITTIGVDKHGIRTLLVIPARLGHYRQIPSILADSSTIHLERNEVFIVTPNGSPHPLPCVQWSGYSYGYPGGEGPMALAAMLAQLLNPARKSDEEFTNRRNWLRGSILEERDCPATFTVGEARGWFFGDRIGRKLAPPVQGGDGRASTAGAPDGGVVS